MFCLRCTMTPDGMGHPIILCPDTDNEEMGRVKSWIGTFPFASSLRKGRIWANNAPSTWIKYLSLSRITSSSTATTCITNNNNKKKKKANTKHNKNTSSKLSIPPRTLAERKSDQNNKETVQPYRRPAVDVHNRSENALQKHFFFF